MVSDKEDRCGAFPFSTDSKDVFDRACKRHDQEYVKKETYKDFKRSRKDVDKEFCENIDKIIETEEFLKGRRLYFLRLKGRVYKGLACGLGRFFW